MSNQPQKPHPPQAPSNSPETWITATEAASALHLSLRTVLSRAASGKFPAIIPDDLPFTYDGKPNYLFRLEALTQNAQFQYLRNHLPAEQACSIDLLLPEVPLVMPGSISFCVLPKSSERQMQSDSSTGTLEK